MKNLFMAFACAALMFGCGSPPPAEEITETPAPEPKPVEFADTKYMDIGKAGIAAFASGDVDKWMEQYADNAVYAFNNGDSLAGKAAITEFWKKRRGEAIESLTFTDDIWLPVNVNQPQTVEAPGIWLLGWYKVNATYKNGKSMSQWIHTTTHFNSEDKIDRVIQYIDMALVRDASPVLK